MVELLLGVDPTQSYGENTNSPTQDFIVKFGIFRSWERRIWKNKNFQKMKMFPVFQFKI